MACVRVWRCEKLCSPGGEERRAWAQAKLLKPARYKRSPPAPSTHPTPILTATATFTPTPTPISTYLYLALYVYVHLHNYQPRLLRISAETHLPAADLGRTADYIKSYNS